MIYIRKDGRVVSRSRNLRGITRYRGFSVSRVHILGTPDGGALLRVRWSDGAYAVAKFASLKACRWWVQARRYWPGARLSMPHEWATELRS